MSKKQKNYAYPRTISTIPYASFITINKYSYNKGMAEVGRSQRDAIGSMQNSGLAKEVADGLANSAKDIYGNGMNKYSHDNEDDALKKLRKSNPMPSKGWFQGREEDNRTDSQIAEDIEFEGRYVDGERQKTTLKEPLERKKEVQKFRDAGYEKAYVDLALPNEFQYQYQANWSNIFKLGTMALLADDPTRFTAITGSAGILGGAFGASMQGLANKPGSKSPTMKVLAQAGQGFTQGAKSASDLFNVNSNIMDPKNIAGLAGMAPNENAIQFFKKMEFRTFSLNFEFASRDKHESEQIENIIKWFKIGMHPASLDPLGSGSGVLLGFPDIFVLEPKFVPVGKAGVAQKAQPHKMMPKTKLCALKGLSVNATPFGTVNTVYDGTIPLITATLTFSELTALTRADFEQDTNF